MTSGFSPFALVLFCLGSALAAPLVLTGCDDATSPVAANGGTAGGGGVGGPVDGAADTHCGGKKQVTRVEACGHDSHPMSLSYGAPSRLRLLHDETGAAGAQGDDQGGDYGATLFNQEGDDDDCKYHVSFATSPVQLNQDVTFTITLTHRTDATPVVGAEPRLEAFLNATHPAPNGADNAPRETAPGVYVVGPVRFDATGDWTARFHFFEACFDLTEDSPHGHIAFFVRVP